MILVSTNKERVWKDDYSVENLSYDRKIKRNIGTQSNVESDGRKWEINALHVNKELLPYE